jgi:hypothetical protein
MTYDYKRLCNELLSYLYQCNWPDGERFYALVERARAALAEPEPEVYYEFSVSNDEYCIEAGGTAPTLQQAIDEGRHYFAEYSQDGQYTLEVRRVETIPVTY